jgi:shikimate dehydrogenase
VQGYPEPELRLMDNPSKLAVLGSPIAHSKSPVLHAAAYAALDLPWTYSAIEMAGPGLRDFVLSLDSGWRGLSLTMPLKRDILPLLDRADELVELTGGANTVLFTGGGGFRMAGFNTDVYGVTRALREGGVPRVTKVHVLGAGATASSVLVAVAALGAVEVLVSARTPGKAKALAPLAERLNLRLTITGLDAAPASFVPDLVVSTLPGGSDVDVSFPSEVLSGSTLFDVAYDPWPSPLATRWREAGGRVVSGLEMLVNQALGQVRVFVTGAASTELDDERRVLDAMRASVGLGSSPA